MNTIKHQAAQCDIQQTNNNTPRLAKANNTKAGLGHQTNLHLRIACCLRLITKSPPRVVFSNNTLTLIGMEQIS
jgi:hypothetical protein